MFLRCNRRIKDGKEHRYWNIVEARRVASGKTIQQQVLYLGEINDKQRRSWQKTIELFDEDGEDPRQVALFADDSPEPVSDEEIVRLRLKDMELHRPRQWGACWLACHLYRQLGLDAFWKERLPVSRKGTSWDNVVLLLVCYRLIEPGSEWRLHRHWFDHSAMGELLGEDCAISEIHKLYRCHDQLLAHKQGLFQHLQQRWKDLFGAKFDVLLYDLTSTYFESDPPQNPDDKRKFGYSRDKRFDCVQVVIALVVTPEGFPLGYEVMSGNTRDSTTLKDFLKRIEEAYGAAERIWVMDRGIPTEQTLAHMRAADPRINYLVGTPKGRLSQLEKQFLDKPWEKVRDQLEVKLLKQDDELYVLAQSQARVHKERSMRRRRLKRLLARLAELRLMKTIGRDELMLKLGAARQQAGRAWALVDITVPDENRAFSPRDLVYALNKKKLRQVIRREGRYLLRSNLGATDPAMLWQLYTQLTEVEEAFKNLKGDLALRPVHHQNQDRIEAHIFIAFLAYCLHVTLRQRLRAHAPGLTPRSVLEKMATLRMIDVHLPTTDGRTIILPRYTQPPKEVKILLETLKLNLPQQSTPKIKAAKK
ncbi:MAG: IS1634 family transposase [Verrucomicrobia bacterium]|nr:IS1634 family transposase [Verrucomicrobiota bacterium]